MFARTDLQEWRISNRQTNTRQRNETEPYRSNVLHYITETRGEPAEVTRDFTISKSSASESSWRQR